MPAGQMKQELKLKVLREPDDDGLFELEIFVSNGQISTSLGFWAYGDDFKEFGTQLTDFPNSLKHTVTFELGEDQNNGEMQWAYYLLLNVFCFAATGQSAIRIITDNHRETPEYQRCEFYIKAEPSSLNRLGNELKNWDPTSEREFQWVAL